MTATYCFSLDNRRSKQAYTRATELLQNEIGKSIPTAENSESSAVRIYCGPYTEIENTTHLPDWRNGDLSRNNDTFDTI